MRKFLLLFIPLLLFISFKGISQCTDPVFSFFQDFTDPIFVMTPDPPECWTETESLQTAYNTDAMRIFGAHNGDPQGMVITKELFNVRGIISFKAKKGQSVFNLPGDGMSVGVIDDGGFFVDLFPFTYETTEATYTFDFSSYTGTGNRIAFARTDTDKKIISITDISYTSRCDPGVTAIAQDITISLDETGNATITPNQVDDGSMDFCNNAASLSIDVSSFTCDNLGANTVTLTAEDTFGNTQAATATVTVETYIDVAVKSDLVIVELDATGSATISPADLIETSSTTCGTISFSLDQSAFTCVNLGDVSVMITATHSTGPDEVTSKMISIVDNIAPVVNVNALISLPLDGTTFGAELTMGMVDNGSTDNCAITSQNLSKTSFSCGDLGENLVTYTISDATGNETESTITVNVTPVIVDETVTTSASNVYCPSGTNPGGTISTGSSLVGIDYYLRDSKDNSIVDGPLAGTGSGLDFATGSIDGSKTFNVYTEKKNTGSALDFDGVDDYIDLGTNHRNITKEVTVAAWINTSFTGASNFIAAKYNGVTGFALYIDADGKANFEGRDGGDYKRSGSSTVSVNDGLWHLIAGTINLNTGEWSVYVDGAQESTATLAPGSTLANSTTMFLGGYTTFYFTGQIDQFAVYNNVLNVSAINALSSSCLTGSETGLVGFYNLDESAGSTIADLSPEQFAGTLNNMDPGSDWVIGGLECEILCDFQMSTEITFGDGENPQLLSQNVSVQLDANGEGSISTAIVDNGSSDNCTSAGNLIMGLSNSTFGCNDVGENTVTFSVADEAGNEVTADITVTVLSPITDQIPVALVSEFCSGESATVSIPGSESGIEYFLRKSADNSIVEGPITGTGGSLDFNTGALIETTDFNVLATFGGGAGTSLDFDGSNDHIDTDVEIPVSSEMTIEAWIYPEGGLTNTIMTNSIHAGTGSTNLEPGEFWFNTASNTNGNGLTFTYIADNGVPATHSRTNILTFNEWNHVAVAFDGSTGIANMWINGVELTTTITAGTSTQMGRVGSPISIGKRHGGSGSQFFSGKIDEVRVWNTLRTTQEITENKDICLAGSESGLLAYFDFEEGANGTINDQVAGGTGTLTNINPATAWVDGVVGCIDVCEVQMSAEVTVTITDTPPIALATNLTLQLNANGSVTINPSDVNNESSDDCTAVQDLVFTLDQSIFSCADIGTNNVIFSVTDLAGNKSETNIIITIEDASAPVIASQNLTVQLDASGNALINAGMIDTGTVDNCSTNITYTLSQTEFSCSSVGTNEVIFTATDETGNVSTETITVTVEDDTAPIALSFLSINAMLDANGNVTVDPSAFDGGSSDNCTSSANLLLSLSESEFSCSNLGENNVIFSVEDESGNIGTSHVVVNVQDNLPPSVAAMNLLILLDNGTAATISPEDINDGSFDNCTAAADLVMSLDITSFDLTNIGENTVTLTVTDAAGNASTATSIVTVTDKQAQTITFGAISDKTFGDADFSLTASADSELPITFSVVSGNISITGTTVSITGAGEATIKATQAGNDTFAPAQQDRTFNIAKADQLLTIDEITNKSVAAEPITIIASVNTDLALTYSVTGPATNVGNVVTLDGTLGTVEVAVTQAGTDNYNAVSNSISFDVIAKQAQTITFTDIPDLTYGAADQTLVATSSSGLTVSFALISGPAVLTGSTLAITGSGTIVVEASQAGDEDFLDASEQQTIIVSKAGLTIVADDQNINYGDAIPALTYQFTGFVNGEGETDLNATISISTTADATGQSDAGSYPITLTVNVSKVGDNYNFSTTDATLTINKLDQFITIDPIEDKEPTDVAFDVVASVDSGLDLIYEVSGPATISGSTITLDGSEGVVTVNVSQIGDTNHNAAAGSVTFNVTIVLAIENGLSEAIQIYPNPVADYIMVDANELVDIRFYGLDGQLIKEYVQVNGKVDVSSMKMGTYLMQVSNSEEQITMKINKAN